MTVEIAFATLMVPIFKLGSVRRIESVCVFVPNTTRYFVTVFLSKNLLFLRKEWKDLLKEFSIDGSCTSRSSAGSKELRRVMSEVWARNAVSKVREGLGCLSFSSLAVVKSGGDSLFEGLESFHSG